MKLHIITIGKPKLAYAQMGWDEYLTRLKRMHTVRITQLSDKYAYDADKILDASADTYRVVLDIRGQLLSSEELADFLRDQTVQAREVSFLIGGPEGLPREVRERADLKLSFGRITLPHDLAMVTLLETLYRSSTINLGLPYHK